MLDFDMQAVTVLAPSPTNPMIDITPPQFHNRPNEAEGRTDYGG